MDTGFKSKGKGNDWKASHKITQWRSQEESLTVPEALANSSCKWTKFPSPTTPPPPRSLLMKRNSSVHNTEKLTKAGWEEAERAVGCLRLYLSRCHTEGKKVAVLRPHGLVEQLLCAGYHAKNLTYII